jgi:L-lactate utilization protein LutC
VVAALTSDYQHLVTEYPAVVNDSKVLPRVTHNVEHFIETTGRLVSSMRIMQ